MSTSIHDTQGRTPGLGIIVRQITPTEVLPLRHQVLRPGRPIQDAIFAGDQLATTTHWGAFSADKKLMAVASLFRAAKPGTPDLAWQLRGMASEPHARGQGFGRAVLSACTEWVRANKSGGILWCNARTSAVGFYLKQGFQKEGVEFEIPGVGPHWVMSRIRTYENGPT
ncbi:GNAT family N-acetyltransferase [Bdellovibrionota bacterium FG-1]